MIPRSMLGIALVGAIAGTLGMPLRLFAADPIHVPVTTPSGPSVSSVELRSSIDRSGALKAGTASLPAGAAGDPRVAWFPIVLAFGLDGCLAGAYELDFISGLNFDCVQGAAKITELFPRLDVDAVGNDGLVLVVVPAALAAMCEPCARVRPTLDAELARRGIQPTVMDVNLVLF
ncbi:MAG TPA: hypothetical protein PLI00_01955 [Pseudomonadota bacterium]|nr:hypothetical protein [Pseudomonadota bacterium]